MIAATDARKSSEQTGVSDDAKALGVTVAELVE